MMKPRELQSFSCERDDSTRAAEILERDTRVAMRLDCRTQETMSAIVTGRSTHLIHDPMQDLQITLSRPILPSNR